jgi:hypothetical protein
MLLALLSSRRGHVFLLTCTFGGRFAGTGSFLDVSTERISEGVEWVLAGR